MYVYCYAWPLTLVHPNLTWSNLLELQFWSCRIPHHTCYPVFPYIFLPLSVVCRILSGKTPDIWTICFVVSRLHNIGVAGKLLLYFLCIFGYFCPHGDTHIAGWIFSVKFVFEHYICLYFALDVYYKRQVRYSYNLTGNFMFS